MMLQKLSSTKNSSWSHYHSIRGSQKMQNQNRRAGVLGKNLIFCKKWPFFGTRVGFWKICQLATISDFHLQGLISKPDTRRLIWVVSWVIWTHGLAARAVLVPASWNIFWFRGGFWKIRLLVTISDLGWKGLIWNVLISASHRHPGQVSSFKNKLSRAILVTAILQSEGFWAHWESAAHFWKSANWWPSPILMIRVANES